ncbi:MAG: ATP-binding cassette domain-containing protein [Spirochaetaceae bacterium]|jgi:D-methionine transport system ATP-binding protein|nr:ATP-binding cassette domain-containing protein [Spirochaetaceae bacterium]
MIQLKNITKTFHTDHVLHAVKDVSLRINDGEIFGVIGFSGAGKSTLVRCINLLERPDKGEVWIDDQNLMLLPDAKLRSARKKIGMIFQHFNLFRSRTVGSNIAFPLKYSTMAKEAIAARVKELLDFVGLADKEFSYPSELSGGQKQRVGIARALSSNPSILLCDEATSALDPQTTGAILALLKTLNKKLGITIIIITHEMQVIKAICNRAAVMDQGVVIEEGSVFDLFSNPQQKITKDFIATTSHLYKIYELLAEDSPLVRLSPGQILAHFSYRGRHVVEALISKASIQFKVELNIIFGDLDIIQETPLGGLIIILDGEVAALKRTIAWFGENGVQVEVLKHACSS